MNTEPPFPLALCDNWVDMPYVHSLNEMTPRAVINYLWLEANKQLFQADSLVRLYEFKIILLAKVRRWVRERQNMFLCLAVYTAGRGGGNSSASTRFPAHVRNSPFHFNRPLVDTEFGLAEVIESYMRICVGLVLRNELGRIFSLILYTET